MSAPRRSSACLLVAVRGVHDRGAVAHPGADQQLLGERDRRDPDLVAVRRERQSAVRLRRAAVVRPGALFRLRHVRRRDRHRGPRPVVLAGFRPRHRRGHGDGAGDRHLRGAADLALFRDHHRGVLADLLFPGVDQQMADRRRRRHQFHAAADLRHSAAFSMEPSPIRRSSISSFWRRWRSASG